MHKPTKKQLIFYLLALFASIQTVVAQSPFGDKIIEEELRNQELKSWQIALGKRKTKTVEHYYLMLPQRLIEGALNIETDSKKFRLEKANNTEHPEVGRTNISNGFLCVISLDVMVTMQVFQDKENERDIIALNLGNLGPPVAFSDFGFITYNKKKQKWEVAKEVFPWKKFNHESRRLRRTTKKFMPSVMIPEFGGPLSFVNLWVPEKVLSEYVWSGTEFEKVGEQKKKKDKKKRKNRKNRKSKKK